MATIKVRKNYIERSVIEIRTFLFLVITEMLMLFFAGNGNATSIQNPNPAVFGDDIGGSGLFIPSPTVINLEGFDLGGTFGFGNTFGFFFETDPSTLITIFDSSDQGPAAQIAAINFLSGVVFDVDDNTIQDTFTGTGNVGLFLMPDPVLGIPTLFTLSSLNPGGVDVAATFPFLGSPDNDFLIAFEDPTGFITPGVPLAFEVTMGITPIPEPTTLLLLASGVVGLAGYGKKRLRS